MIPDRLSWSVAWRSLAGARRLTMLTLLVVSVSAILVVFLSSLIAGLQTRLVQETTGAIPHLTIEPVERPLLARTAGLEDGALPLVRQAGWSTQTRTITNWKHWVETARSFSDDVLAVSPAAEGEGFVVRGGREEPVRIYGIEPRDFDRVVPIQKNLVLGRFYRLGPGEIALGNQLAGELNVVIGDRIQVSTSRGAAVAMRIAGIYETGFGPIDQATVFMLLGDGQSLFGLGSAVTSIGVELRDVFEAELVARQLQRRIPHEVTPWTEDNGRLLRALEAQQQSSDLIVLFTALAAVFAISSILVVLVTNKLSQIGILKAMGATRRQIRTIFALQGLMLAGLGGVIGTSLGFGLVYLLAGIEGPPSPSGRTQSVFPFELSIELAVLTIAATSILGLLASVIPARKASSVDPIEVIRGG